MSTEKKGPGRPTTRSNEAMMLALWTRVQEEIHLRGADGEREACRQLYYYDERGAKKSRVIKFIQPNGNIEDDISDTNADANGEGEKCAFGTFWQRYMRAKRAINEPDPQKPGEMKYPHLHQRAEFLLRSLPEMAARKKADMAQCPDLYSPQPRG